MHKFILMIAILLLVVSGQVFAAEVIKTLSGSVVTDHRKTYDPNVTDHRKTYDPNVTDHRKTMIPTSLTTGQIPPTNPLNKFSHHRDWLPHLVWS